MLNRIAQLEKVVEAQRLQIQKHAEKINEIWKLLQGPDSTRRVLTEVVGIDGIASTPSTLLASSVAANVVDPTTDVAPAKRSVPAVDVPEAKHSSKKRGTTSSPVLKNKKRRSVKATEKFIEDLTLSPINKKKSKSKSTTKQIVASRTVPATPPTTSATRSSSQSNGNEKESAVANSSRCLKFKSIVQVISPESRVICNKLSQCHTYSAVGKLIAVEGTNSAALDQRLAVVCALGEKMTRQSNPAANQWYCDFLGSTGVMDLFVQWLQDFCRHVYKLLDEKMITITQYLNGFNSNANWIIEKFGMNGAMAQYVEVLIFILEEGPWTSSRVQSMRIDKTIKELYKILTNYNKAFLDKLSQPHKLSSSNAELVSLYAFQLQAIANSLKQPWERFRKMIQNAEENEEFSV